MGLYLFVWQGALCIERLPCARDVIEGKKHFYPPSLTLVGSCRNRLVLWKTWRSKHFESYSDFAIKNPFPAPGIKPMTFRLGLPLKQGFASLWSITLPLLVARTLGDLAEVMKNHYCSHRQHCTSKRASVQLLHLQPWTTWTAQEQQIFA